MKMKKLIAAFLALVLILSLAACGGEKPGETGRPGETGTPGDIVEPGETGEPGAFEVTVDADGMARWNAVEGAVGYNACIVTADYVSIWEDVITDTFIQLPRGYNLHIRPVFADGSFGDWVMSDFFGDPANPEEDPFASPEPSENPGPSVEPEPSQSPAPSASPEPSVTPEPSVSPEPSASPEPSVEPEPSVSPDPPDDPEPSVTPEVPEDPLKDLLRYEVISNIDHSSVRVQSDGSVLFNAAGPNGSVMHFYGTGVTVTSGGITFEANGRIVALDSIGRIHAINPVTSKAGTANYVMVAGGYCFSGAVSVNSIDQLEFCSDRTVDTESAAKGMDPIDLSSALPNFVTVSGFQINRSSFTLSEIHVYYDTDSYATGIKTLTLNDQNSGYGTLIEGERYIKELESRWDPAKNIYDFYLLATLDAGDNADTIWGINSFTVGNLKDAKGNVLNKNTAVVSKGMTLEVSVGKYRFNMELPVVTALNNVQNLHDLQPCTYPEATGDLNVLVIPIQWKGESGSDATLDMFRSELGRVMDASGAVTDYSAGLKAGRLSLSDYFDEASYGALHVQSFVTGWYPAAQSFDSVKYEIPTGSFMKDLSAWLYRTYPNMDWSQFDKDGNGYFDAVMLLNDGELGGQGYMPGSFSGGITMIGCRTPAQAGTAQKPAINGYVLAHANLFNNNVLIHEFGHVLGLEDYYDLTNSGIDAVGRFDMQSGNCGDWNAYSKYAVGWITPQVVTGLKSGQSVDITIGSLVTSGDAIIIPAAGSDYNGTPFDEYILVDLFVGEGVNAEDANADRYKLDGKAGVRIYHVNSVLEKEALTDSSGTYTAGKSHYNNNYDTSGVGRYYIELIQKGGTNTFTTIRGRDTLQETDLFRAGSTFTAEAYSQFLHEGKMDDGSSFGYSIKVVSIDNTNGEYSAVIRITRQ